MSRFRFNVYYFWIIMAVLVMQRTTSTEENTFLMPEKDSMPDADVWLQPRTHQHHLAKRQSFFDIPIVNALMWTIGLLAFILPFRLYRVNPVTSMANKRKDAVTSAPLNVTESPMTESAILAHRIVKAVESGRSVCANFTICSMAEEVKKMGSRQEVTISIAEKFLPASLLPTIDVLRKAILFPKVDEFCQQFDCADSQLASNVVSSNSDSNESNHPNSNDHDKGDESNGFDNNNNGNNEIRSNNANDAIQNNNNNNNDIENISEEDRSSVEKAPFPVVEPEDSLEEQEMLDVNATDVQDHGVIPEWKVV